MKSGKQKQKLCFKKAERNPSVSSREAEPHVAALILGVVVELVLEAPAQELAMAVVLVFPGEAVVTGVDAEVEAAGRVGLNYTRG